MMLVPMLICAMPGCLCNTDHFHIGQLELLYYKIILNHLKQVLKGFLSHFKFSSHLKFVGNTIYICSLLFSFDIYVKIYNIH